MTQAPPASTPQNERPVVSFLAGFGAILVLHVVACLVTSQLIMILPALGIVDSKGNSDWGVVWSIYLLGVVQLVYVVPLARVVHRHGGTALAQGMRTCAAVTFLLNAACWGVIVYGSQQAP